jgi:TP901 family phage tail tape measure protein
MAKSSTRRINIYINGKEVEATVKGIRSEMNKLINEQNKMVIGSDQYIAHAKRIQELRGYLQEHTLNISTAASAWDSMQKKMMLFGAGMGGFTQLFSAVNSVVGTLKQTAVDLAEMDDIYSNVRKTTLLTQEQVDKLNDSFKKMDTRTSREQLNNLAYIAGKLGISAEDLVKQFVEASDIINIAMNDVLGEDATLFIGKMTDVYQRSTEILQGLNLKDKMLSIASAVNELGKTSTANEKYMVNFAGRLGGIAVQAKLSADQILGYASALDQDMQKVEMSATAFQKLIQKLISKPAEFAKIAGMEIKEFQKLIETDMNEALKRTLKGFQGAGGFDKLLPIFKDIGLDGARAAAAISSMANSLHKVEEAQATANKAMREATSCLIEYDIKNNNLQANLEKARKRFKDTRLELGEKLYPLLMKLTKTTTGGLKLLAKVIRFCQENKAAVVALIAPYALYLSRLLLVTAAQKAQNTYSKVSIALQNADRAITFRLAAAKYQLAGNTQKATQAMKLYHAAATKVPWIAIATAITAIVIAVGKWIRSNIELNRTFDFQRAYKDVLVEVRKEYEQQASTVKDLLKIIHNENLSNAERLKAIRALKEIMPEYNAQLNTEGRLIEENTVAIDNYLKMLNLKVEATVIKSKMMEAQAKHDDWMAKNGSKMEKQDQKMRERLQKAAEGWEAKWFQFGKKVSGYFNELVWNYNLSSQESAHNILREKGAKIYQELEQWEKAYNKKLEEIEAAGGSPTDVVTGDESGCTGDFRTCDCPECQARRNRLEAEEELNKELAKEWERFKKEMDKLKEEDRLASFKEVEREKEKEIKKFEDQIAIAKKFIPIKGKIAEKAEKQLQELKNKAVARIDEEARKKQLKKVEDDYKKLCEKAVEIQNKLGDALSDKYAVELKNVQRQWNEVLKEIDKNIEFYEKKLLETYDPIKGTGLSPEEVETLSKLLDKKTEAIALCAQEELAIVKRAEEEITVSLMKESEQRIHAIKKEYQERIEIAQTAIAKLRTLDDTEENQKRIATLEQQIVDLKKKLQKEIKDIEKMGKKEGFGRLFAIDWKHFRKDWEKNLAVIADIISEFVNTANQLFDSINQIQANREEKQLNNYRRNYDERRNILDHQLNEGIISQEYYNARVDELDKELDKKQRELELERFRREKKSATTKAIIAGIAAALQSFLNGGGYPWGLIPMALSVATTGAQIAAIQSQPEPYATGGFIEEEKIIRAGEKGREWVASNTLLNDPQTAPVIEALEQYQKGNKSPWQDLIFASPNAADLSQAASAISSNFASNSLQSVTNNYHTNTTATQGNETLSLMLEQITQLTTYMSDPKNRQTVLNRDKQLEFEAQENFLRNAAALK